MFEVVSKAREKWRDEFSRRKLLENAQLYFVAVVWLIVFALMLSLPGCAEKNPPPQTVVPSPTPTPVPTPKPVPGPKEETLAVSYLASSKPDTFTVRLDWTSDQNPRRWLIFRKGSGKASSITLIAAVEGHARAALDHEAYAGAKYTYYLAIGDEQQYSIKAHVEATVPRDFTVSVPYPMPALSGVRRLFLRKGARLKANGAPVEISVQEIVSDGGEIEAFPTGQGAFLGENGRSPGDIVIRARRASGTLTIVAHGESGDNGQDGAKGRDGAQGAQGVPGRYDVKPDNQLPMQKSPAEKEQLKAFYAGKRHDDPVARWDLWFHCIQQTGDGAQGEKGGDGADGQGGGNGGDSAKVYVEIAEDSDFKVEVVGQPGSGGLPGRGGLGGTGGPGGPPGLRDNGHLCRAANPGPKGADGLAGRPGRYGDPGKRRAVCVKVGSKTFGDCK